MTKSAYYQYACSTEEANALELLENLEEMLPREQRPIAKGSMTSGILTMRIIYGDIRLSTTHRESEVLKLGVNWNLVSRR